LNVYVYSQVSWKRKQSVHDEFSFFLSVQVAVKKKVNVETRRNGRVKGREEGLRRRKYATLKRVAGYLALLLH
jgi:hypothetical protein